MKNYIGVPDGMTERLENFLNIRNTTSFNFSSLEPSVIVGRKGSGKSFTMRKFAEAAHGKAERFVVGRETIPPELDGMIKFTAEMPTASRTNTWQKIWDFAIHVSVVTFVLFDDNFSNRFIKDKKQGLDHLFSDYSDCLMGLKTPCRVYSAVQSILRQFQDYESFLEFYRSSECTNFLNTVGKLSSELPTICIYLDALDEELRKAPSLIIDITRALFYVCFNFVRGGEEGRGRIHVMMTMRDIVYSSIIHRSEHSDRYRDTPHIIYLPWKPISATIFCEKKIEMGLSANKHFMADPEQQSQLSRFLGFKTVINEQKDFEEDVENYVIRHVNSSPRTLVTLGNRLFNAREEEGGLSEQVFRNIVNDLSNEMADTLIKISSAYLVASYYDKDIGLLIDYGADLEEALKDSAPFSDEVMKSLSDGSMQSLTDGFVYPIKSFIKSLRSDVFSKEELEKSVQKFRNQNLDYSSIPRQHTFGRIENVLWSQGLLGVRNGPAKKETDEFYFYGSLSRDAALPDEANQFVFFPGLVDHCGLEVVKGVPTGYFVNVS